MKYLITAVSSNEFPASGVNWFKLAFEAYSLNENKKITILLNGCDQDILVMGPRLREALRLKLTISLQVYWFNGEWQIQDVPPIVTTA